jgi:hypothetical protein
MAEHSIQNAIRNALAGKALIFRANVGSAWTGETITKLPTGDMLIKKPRPFNTGLPPGFSDLFGLVQVKITPDMVGQTVGMFYALEVKQPGKKPSPLQRNFLQAVNDNGGIAGRVTSPEEALQLVLMRQG